MGFTTDLCCAVWIGNDDNRPMTRAAGGRFAAPVWREVVREATAILGLKGKFPEGAGVTAARRGETTNRQEEEEEEVIEPPTTGPRTVTICTQSGGLATPYCPDTVERTLGPGEAPPGVCSMHRPTRGREAPPDEIYNEPAAPGGRTVSVTICTESGMPAGPHCPDTVERTFPAGSAPRGTCRMHGGGGAPEPEPTPPAPTPPPPAP